MRYGDAPIELPEEDLLGRRRFAETLAEAIYRRPWSPNSFVIGLTGRWGSGKTSILNMLLRHLRLLDLAEVSRKNSPDDARSESDVISQLARDFQLLSRCQGMLAGYEMRRLDFSMCDSSYRISEFKKILGSDDGAKRVDRLFLLLKSAERERRLVIVSFSPWMISGRRGLTAALLSEIGRTLGPESDDAARLAVADMMHRLAEVGPFIGSGVELFSGVPIKSVFSAGGNATKAFAKRLSEGRSMAATRENLRSAINSNRDLRIVITIDDLDRLTPAELPEIFSAVSSVADLPNCVYILSFDRAIVTRSLANVLALDTDDDYIAKIVQFMIAVPEVSSSDLLRLLDADLEPLIGDDDRLHSSWILFLWEECVSHMITTPRDVRRFINSFDIAYSTSKEYTNLDDLFLMEALKLFDPELVEWIMRNESALTNRHSLRTESDRNYLSAEIPTLVASNRTRQIALRFLFPNAAAAMNDFSFRSGDASSMAASRQICSPESFYRYFDLNLDVDAWSIQDINRAINSSSPEDALHSLLRRVDDAPSSNQARLKRSLLSSLADELLSRDGEQRAWLVTLANNSHAFLDAERTGILASEGFDQVCSVVRRVLRNESQESQLESLFALARQTTDISVSCDVFRDIIGDRRPEGARRNSGFSEDEVNELRSALLSRVREAASANNLLQATNPGALIWFGSVSVDGWWLASRFSQG